LQQPTHGSGDYLTGEFINKESWAGLMLMTAAVLALVFANTPLDGIYARLLEFPIAVTFGNLSIDKPALLWINDGLTSVFFFLIALEVKRELLIGQFQDRQAALFPLAAAIGGMVVPAVLFYSINQSNAETVRGWAIPAATDIAFALGILALLGRGVPAELKILLLAIAIIDNIGAIIVVALFYTDTINLMPLAVSLVPIAGLLAANRFGIARSAPYVVLGLILWVCVLESGIHTALAAVIAGFFVPVYVRGEEPLERIEHALLPWVAFMVMPIFAFANAGLRLGPDTLSELGSTMAMGIVAGLVVGKPLGIFGIAWLGDKSGLIKKPQTISWGQVLGLSCLAGVGFTMSLFIGTLEFTEPQMIRQLKLGVIAGSLISAGLAVLILSTERARVNAFAGDRGALLRAAKGLEQRDTGGAGISVGDDERLARRESLSPGIDHTDEILQPDAIADFHQPRRILVERDLPGQFGKPIVR